MFEWWGWVVAFGVLGVARETDTHDVVKGQWTALVSQFSVTGTGAMAQITGYARGIDDSTYVQVLVDGLSVGNVVGSRTLVVVCELSAGEHTVDFEVYGQMTEGDDEVAGERAITVVNLG